MARLTNFVKHPYTLHEQARNQGHAEVLVDALKADGWEAKWTLLGKWRGRVDCRRWNVWKREKLNK